LAPLKISRDAASAMIGRQATEVSAFAPGGSYCGSTGAETGMAPSSREQPIASRLLSADFVQKLRIFATAKIPPKLKAIDLLPSMPR